MSLNLIKKSFFASSVVLPKEVKKLSNAITPIITEETINMRKLKFFSIE